MDSKPTILFIAIIPRDYSPYQASAYGMERTFDLLPHKYAILALVSWLRAHGCEGHYVWINEANDEEGMGIIDKAVELIRPNAFGLSLVTEEMVSHYKLIENLKKHYPEIPVIVGGPHVTHMPEHTLENFPLIDFVAIGEGEETLHEWLLKTHAGQGKWEMSDVDGLAFKDQLGRIVLTKPREQIPNINFLPDPAYDLVHDPEAPKDNRAAFPLVCSYGCYFNCTFCSVEHGNYRSISPEKLADRIEWAKKEYGVDYFAIRDSFWPPTREWLNRFCDEIEKRKVKIQFHFQTRANTLTKENLLRLKKIGVKAIAIGVEAGDPDILKSIKKSITVNMARRGIKALNDVGVFSIAFFIFGNKGENRKTIQASIDLSRELNPSIAFYHVLYPLPGAEAFDSVPENEKEWWMGKSPLPSICDLPVNDLEKLATEAFIKFPLRWNYLGQQVLGGKLSLEFRKITTRIFFVHLRKYILGNLERVGIFRAIFRGMKPKR
ncbi:MAG: radical SAM protein [bacterium]|nr:radical SAM protein [bacterium]